MRAVLLVVVGAIVSACVSVSAPPIERPVASATNVPQTLALATASPPTATVSPTRVPTAQATEAGTPDPNATPTFDIRALLGAHVTIFNLADFELSIHATITDATGDGEDVEVEDFDLAPAQATTRSLLAVDEPIAYEIEFSYAAGATAVGGLCTIGVTSGDDYTFVAVNEGLTVTSDDATPAHGDELFLDTSSLCRFEPAPSATP